MSDTTIPERKRNLPDHPALISSLVGVLSDDHQRVKVTVSLTNGETHPDLELSMRDADQKEICRTTIIENFGSGIVFTMHIRQPQVKYPLTVKCCLSYVDGQIHSEKEATVEAKN